MYAERPSVVPHTVAWVSRSEPGAEHRILPDGCMDVILMSCRLVVAGPDTAARVAACTPLVYTGLRFGSGVGPRVVGVPAHEVRNQLVPLADLWPSAQVRRLTERLVTTLDPHRVLEESALARLDAAGPPDPLAEHAELGLRQGGSVDDVARLAGFSARQLYRRSLDAFGYGPKMLARILRFNRALDLGRTGLAPAEVAASTGYADQAHLAREVKVLAGTTFTALVR